MKDRLKAMLLGSFAGDALALGPHWVYNTRVIDKKFGTVDRFYDPLTSYHAGKKKGDFTHYGDQMLVLLESTAAFGGFDLDHFSRSWRSFFESYQGYFDHATKDTLENMHAGKKLQAWGSSSDDLSGASRIAPVVYACHHDLTTLVDAARNQTTLTHNHPTVVDAAEFLALTVYRVLNGRNPLEAMAELVADKFPNGLINALVTAGLDSKSGDTRQIIAQFGQMCSIEAALPATVHLIAKYEQDFRQAMVENVMAGGDSAARGMLVGMVLGAAGGTPMIPPEWTDGLNAHERITALMQNIDEKIKDS
jgi:ADP-ribosylglycohydrolase